MITTQKERRIIVPDINRKSRIAAFGVDLQNCFGMPNGGLFVPSVGKYEFVSNGNLIVRYVLQKNGLAVFSKDQHPPDSDHFRPKGPWPPHGIAGTWDGEIMDIVYVPSNAIIISKGTKKHEHGYDPFEGKTDSGKSTEQVLDDNEIGKIIFFGLVIEYCVKEGVLTACKLNKYKVYMVTDASCYINKADELKAIQEMLDAGAIMTTTEEVLRGQI